MKLPWYVRLDRYFRRHPRDERRYRDMIVGCVMMAITMVYIAEPPERLVDTALALMLIGVMGMNAAVLAALLRSELQKASDKFLDKGTKS
jgi:hypothetical protein